LGVEVMAMNIVAISGSLRTGSTNTTLLQAAVLLAPEGVTVQVYEGIGRLPFFNPDIEETELPIVQEFQTVLRSADGILFSTPEYAHGVPGVLKNALDWVVRSGELEDKPVALWNAAPFAVHAQASLEETLRTMSARVVEGACVRVPLTGKKLDGAGIAQYPEFATLLRVALGALAASVW